MLVKVAGGYRFQSHPDLTGYVERFVLEGQNARLSSAALETLAIVAYKQPISRAPDRGDPRRQRRRRGAHARAARATSPRSPAIPVPARPCCSARPTPFLERLGLDSLDDLPSDRRRSCPAPTWSRRSSTGLRVDPIEIEIADDDGRAASDTADAGADRSRRAQPDRPRRPRLTVAADDEGERLQKVLARAGLGSRRVCEDLIADGAVTVNGEVADLGRRVDVDADLVEVDGAAIGVRPGLVYYLLNKPTGVVTTADDPQGRPTVVELVPDEPRVFPVGRLDLDTEGLLLLTNDGELTHRLTHPCFGVEKEYLAAGRGRVRRRAGCAGCARASSSTTASPHPRRSPRVAAGPAAHRDPRGSQPPGPAHVRGGRPSGRSAWCAPASARSPTARCSRGLARADRRRGAGARAGRVGPEPRRRHGSRRRAAPVA